MDLTEFLLARVAEDEAPTWSLQPYGCEPGCCAPAGWVGAQCRYCDAAPVYGGTVEAVTAMAEDHAEAIHQRSRVVAECEAKRRMVGVHSGDSVTGRCQVCTYEGETEQQDGWERYDVHEDWPCPTLRLLALPYADHPDYRAEWKP